VKIEKTFAYCLIFIFSLTGNTLIGIIVYKTKTMKKTTNFLLANMAVSDLLLPIFLFPQVITELYINSWLVGGLFGRALGKLYIFVSDVSVAVSIQSLLVLIAADRFGAVIFPLLSPLISPKLYLFLIPATWIIAMAVQSPYLFVSDSLNIQGGWFALGNGMKSLVSSRPMQITSFSNIFNFPVCNFIL